MASNLSDIYVGVKKNDKDRKENDFYPTPPLATFILHKYVNIPKTVVEPCAGRGNISIELIRQGYNVKSFDLYEYENSLCDIETGVDVLSLPKQEGYSALVTNPPYHKDLPRKIALKGIQDYDLTAMFLRLTFLEGKKRNELFTTHPPSDIIFLSDRINFGSGQIEPVNKKEQIGGMIAYAWFIFRKGHIENTNLKWVLLEDEYDEWRDSYDQYYNTGSRSCNKA